jgi:type IV pilus assembly protein PilN
MAGKSVNVDVASMFLSILWVVILPIVVGLVVKWLLPKYTAKATDFLPAFSSLAIALIVAIVAIMMIQTYTSETISTLSTELNRVQEEVERERPLLSKISDLEQKQGVVNTKINALKSIQINKKRWVTLFENISSVLPPNMWIESISQMGEFNLEMRGKTYDFSEVAEYMVKLEKQVSVESVTLVTISTTKVEGEEAYNFTIKVVLKRDFGLGEEG